MSVASSPVARNLENRFFRIGGGFAAQRDEIVRLRLELGDKFLQGGLKRPDLALHQG